jgi:hypothetical protein
MGELRIYHDARNFGGTSSRQARKRRTPPCKAWRSLIARACKATRIVEFGTSMGISTIYLAAALRDNGGGHLISSELEPGKVARARANLAAGHVAALDPYLLSLTYSSSGSASRSGAWSTPRSILFRFQRVIMDRAYFSPGFGYRRGWLPRRDPRCSRKGIQALLRSPANRLFAQRRMVANYWCC